MRSSFPTSTRRFCTAPLDTFVPVDESGRVVPELSCPPGVSADLNSAVISVRRALISSVSSRNDCSSIARLISITPLQNLYLCIACIRAKHDALPSVHANNSGHHWDLRLRQCFQRHLHVSAAQVLLFSRTRFAHGIEQAASTEHLGSKLSAIGASF